ncbi:hypothetical protein ANCCAN_02302 [Ancylostoma caninum]|uniref:Uncharacterized protein n=1 Tax=Ancylostoma caninum TaxID=29170 RepID=A0A368H4Z0_ANCCA|nr:hypothetical protein ANCCAN_02302 [Ancylostoma caninum]
MDDLRYTDADDGEEYETPVADTMYATRWSTGDDTGPMMSPVPSSVEEGDNSYYYDAEEEFSPRTSLNPPNHQPISWEQSETDRLSEASHSETVSSTMEERSSETSLDSSGFSYRIKSASCSDLVDGAIVEKKEKRRKSMPELLELLNMDVYAVEERTMFDGSYPEEEKARRKRLMLQVFDRLRKNETLKIKRGDSSVKQCVEMDVAGPSNDGCNVYALSSQMGRAMLVRRRPSDDPDIKQTRIEAKKECLRLWGNKVQNLAELLCFLKLFHSFNGPMLIDDCEYHIEAFVNPSCTPGDLSWIKYGRDMSVGKMFELKMFRLAEPLSRMKVQPADCILNARFRVLSRGLVSEVYHALAHVKKATIEDISHEIQDFLGESDEEARQEELQRAVRSAPDVFVLDEEFIELKNDEEFFVVTDIPDIP